MTQSNKDNDITINLDDYLEDSNTITISMNDTMNTTTTYWEGDNLTDITFDTSTSDGTFTIDTGSTVDISGYTTDWIFTNNSIDPDKVERMCKEYPALEKVWRNFKSVYDMVNQDYEGKKEAGELDDELPF